MSGLEKEKLLETEENRLRWKQGLGLGKRDSWPPVSLQEAGKSRSRSLAWVFSSPLGLSIENDLEWGLLVRFLFRPYFWVGSVPACLSSGGSC